MRALYPTVTLHDFRVVWGVTHSNVVFDVAVPFAEEDSDETVSRRIGEAVAGLDPKYRAVVTVDRGGTDVA